MADITKRTAVAAAKAAKATEKPAAKARFAPQTPPAVAAPPGVTLGEFDADLFGTFCSDVVHDSSGVFNKHFWQVDVPRAAVTYPAVWHAGIALAAIHLSVRKSNGTSDGGRPGTGTGTSRGKPLYNSSSPHNRQYLLALAHFHKSIHHLAAVLQARRGKLSYLDQEMAILTNLLFIGITGMLEDPEQIRSHYDNLFLLLKSFRFGDDDDDANGSSGGRGRSIGKGRSRGRGRGRGSGILDQDELRSVVLSMEGSWPYVGVVTAGQDDEWVVKIPQYEAFASVTQAYMEFLIILHGRLRGPRPRPLPTGHHAAESSALLGEVRAFEAKLLAFEQSADTLDQSSRDAIEYMRRHMQVTRVRVQAKMRTCREDAIQGEQELAYVVDYLEQGLSKPDSLFFPSSASSCSSPDSSSSSSSPSPSRSAAATGPPAFVFSPSFGTLIEILFFQVGNLAIKNRVLDLVRKWPYKECGSRSEEGLAYVEAAIAHELSGPARTLPYQLAGMPILPTFANGGLKDRQFDGTRECECLTGLFVCYEHTLGDWRLNASPKRPSHELANKYEVRCGLPYTRYYFWSSCC